MYQLSRIPFESKTILLTYWRFRLYRDHCFGEAPPLNFRDLNVTGNDVYATEFDGPWLRRFQVVDENRYFILSKLIIAVCLYKVKKNI